MRSLTAKLILAFLTVALVGVLLVAFFIGRQTEVAFNRFLLDHNQEQILGVLTRYYAVNGSWQGLDDWFAVERPGLPPVNRHERDGWGVVTDVAGLVVFPTRGRPPSRRAMGELESGVPIYASEGFEENRSVVGYVLFDWRPGAPGGETPESLFLVRLRTAMLWGALAAIAIALPTGVLLARTITRPILALTEAAQRVAGGELGHTVAVSSTDEIGHLTTAFNRMSVNLDKSARQRKQMTADIAHDLRTPLSIILGYMEALSDGKLAGTPELYGAVHSEARHLNHLIDDLRTLSLAEAGELALTLQRVAPADLLVRSAAAHSVHAAERAIALTVAAAADLPAVDVDLERMAQVFNNLVSNALRHTPAGGRITLSATGNAGRVELSVQDTGEGISAADLPYVFDRFYRGDQARASNGESGLGLPIAKSIVELHGGTIQVTSSPGQGATFCIALPAASSIREPADAP